MLFDTPAAAPWEIITMYLWPVHQTADTHTRRIFLGPTRTLSFSLFTPTPHKHAHVHRLIRISFPHRTKTCAHSLTLSFSFSLTHTHIHTCLQIQPDGSNFIVLKLVLCKRIGIVLLLFYRTAFYARRARNVTFYNDCMLLLSLLVLLLFRCHVGDNAIWLWCRLKRWRGTTGRENALFEVPVSCPERSDRPPGGRAVGVSCWTRRERVRTTGLPARVRYGTRPDWARDSGALGTWRSWLPDPFVRSFRSPATRDV